MFQSRIVNLIGSSIGVVLYTHIMIPASFTLRDASMSVKLLKTSSAGPFHVNFTDLAPSLNFSVELVTVALPLAVTNDGTPSSKVYCALIAAYESYAATNAAIINRIFFIGTSAINYVAKICINLKISLKRLSLPS